MALVLTIDLGTTNVKVGVVDERGDILSLCTAPTPTFRDEAGTTLHHPEEIQKSILLLANKAMKDVPRGQIRYISGATYQFGLMMLDEKKRPISGMNLLTDTRTQQTFREFSTAFDGADLYRKTGCPMLSQYVLPRLFFFLHNEPELFRHAAYFHDSKSFLFHWLTGEWVTDMSIAVATQFYNILDYRWDEGLLGKLGLKQDQFPIVEDGTTFKAGLKEDIRSLMGLDEGVEVMLGVYDGAALGAGLTGFRQGVGIMNIGTTAMLRVPGSDPALDRQVNKRIQAYPIKKDFFLNGGALNNAALPLNWMKENLFEIDINSGELADDFRNPPLMCLPYLTGERDTEIGPFASGVFFGIRKYHKQIDFGRAVLEGVTFSMRYLFDALADNQIDVSEIAMGGGGTKIGIWPQLFADILNKPIALSKAQQPALVGSALLALVAGGIYKDTDQAAEVMLQSGRLVIPGSKNVGIRSKQYEFFKKLRAAMGALYREHASMQYENILNF